MMRRIKAAALAFLCALGTGVAFAHDEGDDWPRVATEDKIRIIVLQASGPVTHGVETKFTIEIEAELALREGRDCACWVQPEIPQPRTAWSSAVTCARVSNGSLLQ